jgi:YVTN family beta-propeller protein
MKSSMTVVVAAVLLMLVSSATADWGTTTVTAGEGPYAVAVNPVTNKVYVANRGSDNVTVVDGATNDTQAVDVDNAPIAVAVKPVTNKVYVANRGSNNVTVIDGATNDTLTVAAGTEPLAVAANPVTNKVYVANLGSDNVTVLDEAPFNDTKVRSLIDRLPGDTAVLAQPQLTGKGVNRSVPNRTSMMGVANRVGTAQLGWDWAEVTSGQGTDSITWAWNWGDDSLMMGENFLVAVPLEGQAATANNLGLGTPFAGNLEVYPVYRMEYHVGRQEPIEHGARKMNCPSIVRGVLLLPGAASHKPQAASLLDVGGRKVMELHAGANDVRHLSPGVYFVRSGPSAVTVRKVVIQR